MDKQEFTDHISAQFRAGGKLDFQTRYREREDWDSFTAISVMAVIFKKYRVRLKNEDIRSTHTVEELYDLVMSRI